MLRASNRILLGIVLLTISSITMAQMVHHGKATSAIQLFLVAIAPADAPQVVNVNFDDAPTLETNLLGVGTQSGAGHGVLSRTTRQIRKPPRSIEGRRTRPRTDR